MKHLATLLLAATALCAQSLDKPKLEAYLRHMELWIPQVTVSIDDPKPSSYLPGFNEVVVRLSYNGQGKNEKYLVSADGNHVIKGSVYDLNQNPFKENLDLLKTDLQPSFGTPGAPVVLVVFADFQCPYCKAEAEMLRSELLKAFPDKVRVYFKDFPLESIHPWARPASIAGRCVFRQNAPAFWTFHDWIYKNQGDVTLENLNQKVLAWAGENGVDAVQLGRCMETKATDADVAKNMQEGLALGVGPTPTTFLNGRKLEGAIQWPVLQQLINMELQHQVTVPDAGEKCCEVTIPSLVPGGK